MVIRKATSAFFGANAQRRGSSMKRLLNSLLFFFAWLGVASSVFASQDGFCAGFEAGYKSVKGDKVTVPLCPFAPITPIGSTDFREGIKAGIRAAKKGY
jgi:hypothetical protein